MLSGFKTKKIQSPETLGHKFRTVRNKKEVTLEDAENGTRVKSKFLKALEEGKWLGIAPDAYVRGFVLAYAKYLEIPKEEALRLFDEELLINRKETANQLYYEKKFKETRVLLTPKLVGYVALSLVVCFMFGYIIYQVMSFAGQPNLQIVSPNNNSVFDTDSIDIKGISDTDAYLTINAETVPVTNDGHFNTSLKLHQGLNVVKIKAVNKAEKSTSEVLTIEYKPKTAQVGDPLGNQQ